MALGTHARVDEDLGHGIPGRGIGLSLVGLVQGLYEIDWMVIGDVLKRIGHAFDQVFLTDYGAHSEFSRCKTKLLREW